MYSLDHLSIQTRTTSITPINEKKLDGASCLVTQIGTQALETTDKNVESPSLHSRVNSKNTILFRFPEKAVLTLNTGKTVDISGIEIDLFQIFKGGIGYGSGASKLSAQAMQAIGHGESVYNLPYCLEGVIRKDFIKIQMISAKDQVIPASSIREIIHEALEKGLTHINLPIDLNGHASLAAIVLSNEGSASLRFYDSLSPSIMSYRERYHDNKALIEFISTLLPSTVCFEKENISVLHLLDQGGEESAGCGYYALYTALLLKDHVDLRNLTSFNDAPMFDETHDKKIRAELVIRTLLAFGTENVVHERWSDPRDGIFNRIGSIELEKLIKTLNQLTSE